MKKFILNTIKFVGVFFLWVLYGLFTQDARLRYMHGKTKGMRCTNMDRRFTYTDLTFQPNEEPIREFATFKQFFNRFGLLKK